MKENEAVAVRAPEDTRQTEEAKPRAYRVEDDHNIEEKDLKRTFLFGNSEDKDPDQPGYEGEGMGGQSFQKNNVTPAGDDPANPSRNAGYANAYFKRTEPSEEHPENTNFKDAGQSGQPNYQQAQPKAEGNGQEGKEEQGDDAQYENTDPNTYQEGTVDNDGKNDESVNIPGPGELPEQQEVGENNHSEPGEANYKPEYDEGKPDYGSKNPAEDIDK
jgi:hypothetical protein